MSFQLSDIVTKVQQRIKDTGYASGEIINYINDTQNDVFNEYRLPFMETTYNYTLTPNVSDISNGSGLQTNYVQALDFTLTTTGREKVIPFIDIRQVDNFFPDPDDSTGHPASVPQYIYYYAETLRTYPVPDIAYTGILRYYKKPTILNDDSDVPEIPSEFEEILVEGAAYRVLQIKDNYDQAAIHQNKYDEILQKLVVKYSQPQIGTPTIMRINRRALGKKSF